MNLTDKLKQVQEALEKILVLGLEPHDLPDNIRVGRMFTSANQALALIPAMLEEVEAKEELIAMALADLHKPCSNIYNLPSYKTYISSKPPEEK